MRYWQVTALLLPLPPKIMTKWHKSLFLKYRLDHHTLVRRTVLRSFNIGTCIGDTGINNLKYFRRDTVRINRCMSCTLLVKFWYGGIIALLKQDNLRGVHFQPDQDEWQTDHGDEYRSLSFSFQVSISTCASGGVPTWSRRCHPIWHHFNIEILMSK